MLDHNNGDIITVGGGESVWTVVILVSLSDRRVAAEVRLGNERLRDEDPESPCALRLRLDVECN